MVMIFELMNSLFYHTIHCYECVDVVTVLIWTCTCDSTGPMDDVSSPGPIDGTVLTSQAHHRSTWIWEHGVRMNLTVFEVNSFL